jgi:hypothetical protein
MDKAMNLQQILKFSRFPGWIHRVPIELQEEAEQIHDEWIGMVREASKNRHEEMAVVRREIRAWKEESDMVAFGKAARLRYLKGQLRAAMILFSQKRDAYIEVVREYGKSSEEAKRMAHEAEGISKKISGYEASIDISEGKRNTRTVISQDMIDRAREFPLKNFIEVGPNGRAKCVFHGGEGWNMDIRKNFAHCYVCDASGDAIAVYQAKHGTNFRETILSLQ